MPGPRPPRVLAARQTAARGKRAAGLDHGHRSRRIGGSRRQQRRDGDKFCSKFHVNSPDVDLLKSDIAKPRGGGTGGFRVKEFKRTAASRSVKASGAGASGCGLAGRIAAEQARLHAIEACSQPSGRGQPLSQHCALDMASKPLAGITVAVTPANRISKRKNRPRIFAGSKPFPARLHRCDNFPSRLIRAASHDSARPA